MRVLFCKIHFSFICFCKPSSHLYTPSPLKLQNTPHASPPQPPDSNNSLEEAKAFESNGTCNGDDIHPSEIGLKSILRKATPDYELVEKKKVQWVDLFGEQLAEIKEFETSEDEDTLNQRVNNRRCVCNIL